MTAFLSFPFSDRIELLVDGATCLPSGLFIHDTNKIVVSPYVPMAITGRGQHGDLKRMTDQIIKLSSFGSVDDALDALAASLGDVRADPGEPVSRHFELVIAAFSETRGLCHFLMTSVDIKDGPMGSFPAWTLIDWTGQFMAGGPDLSEEVIGRFHFTPESLLEGAAGPGLTIMQALREVPGSDSTDPNGIRAYWIGGHVDHAVISASGVVVNRIHDWHDELMKPIAP